MYSHHDEVEMTRKYRKEHDLLGYEAEDLLGYQGLTKSDSRTSFISDEEMKRVRS